MQMARFIRRNRNLDLGQRRGVRLPKELEYQLRIIAVDHQVGLSEVLRWAAEYYVDDRKKRHRRTKGTAA